MSKRGIRGVRDAIPPGFVVGRAPGLGGAAKPGVVDMRQFATKAYVAQTTTSLPSINDGYTLQNQTGATAVPGGVSVSSMLDYVFGNPALQGQILYRDTNANGWKALATGGANNILTANGAASNPTWDSLSALLDTVFGSSQGDILYRDAAAWKVLAPGTSGNVLTTQGAAANPKWAAGGGGSSYPTGTLPTVVQTAYNVGGGNSVTFGVAPTNGNLLFAMWFNPTSNSLGTGWSLQANNSSGTDYGITATKVAGAGESTTQTPAASIGATGCMMVWEINGQAASNYLQIDVVQAEFSGPYNSPVAISNSKNCLALSAVSGVTNSIQKVTNIGTQDVLDNSNGNRKLVAGHTDISQTPNAGIICNFASTTSTKGATCLISS